VGLEFIGRARVLRDRIVKAAPVYEAAAAEVLYSLHPRPGWPAPGRGTWLKGIVARYRALKSLVRLDMASGRGLEPPSGFSFSRFILPLQHRKVDLTWINATLSSGRFIQLGRRAISAAGILRGIRSMYQRRMRAFSGNQQGRQTSELGRVSNRQERKS
jgi:hypothetical protein